MFPIHQNKFASKRAKNMLGGVQIAERAAAAAAHAANQAIRAARVARKDAAARTITRAVRKRADFRRFHRKREFVQLTKRVFPGVHQALYKDRTWVRRKRRK